MSHIKHEADQLNSTVEKARDPNAPAAEPHLLDVILRSLDDSKSEETVSIPIAEKSSIADNLVVTSGRSHRHVSAVSDRLLRDLKDAGFGSPKVEGMPACDWVLVDAGHVIVHIFRPEVRDFYNIEKMWMTLAEDA